MGERLVRTVTVCVSLLAVPFSMVATAPPADAAEFTCGLGTCAIQVGGRAGEVQQIGYVPTFVDRVLARVNTIVPPEFPGQARGTVWVGITTTFNEFMQVGWSVDTASGTPCDIESPQWFVFHYTPGDPNPHHHEESGPCSSVGGNGDENFFELKQTGSSGEEIYVHRWTAFMNLTPLYDVHAMGDQGVATSIAEISVAGASPPNSTVNVFGPVRFRAPALSVSNNGQAMFPVWTRVHTAPLCPPGQFSAILDQPADRIDAGTMLCQAL